MLRKIDYIGKMKGAASPGSDTAPYYSYDYYRTHKSLRRRLSECNLEAAAIHADDVDACREVAEIDEGR